MCFASRPTVNNAGPPAADRGEPLPSSTPESGRLLSPRQNGKPDGPSPTRQKLSVGIMVRSGCLRKHVSPTNPPKMGSAVSADAWRAASAVHPANRRRHRDWTNRTSASPRRAPQRGGWKIPPAPRKQPVKPDIPTCCRKVRSRGTNRAAAARGVGLTPSSGVCQLAGQPPRAPNHWHRPRRRGLPGRQGKRVRTRPLCGIGNGDRGRSGEAPVCLTRLRGCRA